MKMSCANQNSYDVGDAVKLYGDFTNPDTGLHVDPAGEISITIRKPNGIETKLVYLTDLSVIRVTTGQYTYTVVVDQAGDWFYRWAGEGQAQEEKRFYVKAGVVTS